MLDCTSGGSGQRSIYHCPTAGSGREARLRAAACHDDGCYYQRASWPATRKLVPASFEGRDLEFLDAISLALGISGTKQRRFQGGNSLLSLLERFSTQLSSDLRDLVYSLVGLEDTTSTMEIDYDMELREVFTNAAIHIIEDIGDLSVLAFGGSVLGLPLWVLDWRVAR